MKKSNFKWSLWGWVIAAFLLLIAGWTSIIFIAVNNQPEKIEITYPNK